MFRTPRPALSALSGLLLLGASLPAAVAQNAAPPAPVTVTPAPVITPPVPVMTPPVPVTTPPAAMPVPTASGLLAQMTAAQKAVTALSATLTSQSSGGPEGSSQTITYAFQRDAGAKATVADGTGPLAVIVSDGKTLTSYDVHAKQYQTQPLPAGQDAVSVVLTLTRSLLPRMMADPDGLVKNFSRPGIQSVLSTDTVGTTTVDVVTFQLPLSPGQPKVSVALGIGHDDHLLRKLSETVTLTQGGKSQTFTHTETVTALTLSPTLTSADFAFVAPTGATKASPEAAEPPMYDPRLKPGARPFPLTARDLSGKPLTLTQYKGKVVLMDFWATWCGPCVGEMPNVIATYQKYHAKGFDVVGISLDQDKSALTAFLAHNKMPWRQVFDGKGWGSAVPHQYGVMAIPFGLLLNRDGTIAAVSVRGDALPAAVKVALAKK